MRDFKWGYTQSGNRLHVVTEMTPDHPYNAFDFIGIAFCGAVVRKVVAEDQMQFWPPCSYCERLVEFLTAD